MFIGDVLLISAMSCIAWFSSARSPFSASVLRIAAEVIPVLLLNSLTVADSAFGNGGLCIFFVSAKDQPVVIPGV